MPEWERVIWICSKVPNAFEKLFVPKMVPLLGMPRRRSELLSFGLTRCNGGRVINLMMELARRLRLIYPMPRGGACPVSDSSDIHYHLRCMRTPEMCELHIRNLGAYLLP